MRSRYTSPCMERLDRIGWSDGFAFIAYGRRFGVRTTNPALLPRFLELIPPGGRLVSATEVEYLYSIVDGRNGGRAQGEPPSRVHRFSLAYMGIVRIGRSLDMETLIPELQAHMHLMVAALASNRIFIHAGVVGWKGRAILIPGRSSSGKTSLVRELLLEGATFYSDEYAVTDKKGRVHPFPRALHLRDSDGGGVRQLLPSEIGAETGSLPLPVGMAAFLSYVQGASFRTRTMTEGAAVLALLSNTVSARVAPRRALPQLGAVVRHALLFQGKRGEASTVAGALLGRCHW